ncbi:hypothetical protein [Prauserella alba]|uniref:DUF4129 domain-containing protein n=1 Tax=Prauserella alba TaxID=176898 RepID=A0ABN1V749_9PSEU|nr:hypothetical protein [Prauserella alba]MCP2180156.1 hypothetical protein [Prauserella alba]
METDPPAARYFPYATESMVRAASDADRPAQARAVRDARANDIARKVAWPFWYAPVVNAFTLATPRWPVGVIVTVVGIAVVAGSYVIRGRRRDSVRRANRTIGIPLPDDMVVELTEAGQAVHAIDGLFDLAEQNPVVYGRVRRGQRQLTDLEDAYIRHLLDARRHWVESNFPAWRDAASEATAAADRLGAEIQTLHEGE